MKPYMWMMDYTPQEDWIDRQGLLLWLAFTLTEVGAGLYLISLFFDFWGGCVAGWLISAILGGGLHMLYLGKPMRAWRAVLHPVKSELSRGLIFMGLFLGFGVLHLAPFVIGGLPWTSSGLFFKVIMTILGFFVITHGFMTMNVMSSIPFWNSSILPVLSLASGIWLGTQLGSVMNGEVWIGVEAVARWTLFAYAFMTIFYFWNAHHATTAVKESLRVIVKGELSPFFYVGVVLLGLIIPLAITIVFWVKGPGEMYGLLFLRFICAFIGDLTLRYLISKAGRYSPLVYSNVAPG